MKVALILTGHVRGWRPCYQGIKKHLLDNHDVDIYISTWTENNQGRTSTNANWYDTVPIDLQPVIDLYKPKIINALNPKEYYATRFPPVEVEESKSFWVERLRDQFYVKKLGYELIPNPEEYDIIVLQRLDLMLESINLKKVDNIVLPDDKSVARCFRSQPKIITRSDGSIYEDYTPSLPLWMTDHMAYGSPSKMKIYCDIFDYMPDYFKDNTNIFAIECCVGKYITQYKNITPLRDIIDYYLIQVS